MPATASLDPRKTPRQKRSAAMVEAIVEAAARVLETEGLAGYTTNAIAARAGVSVGSLYQYFPGKDALTAAVAARESSQLEVEVAQAFAEPDREVALRGMISAAVAHQMRRPILARLLDFEERRPPFTLAEARKDDRFAAAVAAVLSRPPAFPAAETGAHDLLAMVRGLCDMAGERGETDAAELERRVSCAVFGYLDHMHALAGAEARGGGELDA